jgi:hypothetical protein
VQRSKKQRAGVRNNLTPNEIRNVRAVYAYEIMNPSRKKIISGNDLSIDQRIDELLKKQPPLDKELIV